MFGLELCTRSILVLSLITPFAQASCQQDNLLIHSDSPAAMSIRRRAAARGPDDYMDPLPRHFQTIGAERFDNMPASNPVTNAGASLGRFIFYDTRLSANGTVSCGSCHDQSRGFSDPNSKSLGINGRHTERKAMNLTNLRYYPRDRFFWDERAETLEEAVLDPIVNSRELGNTVERVVQSIRDDLSYRPLFEAAFGSDDVDADRVARALAQFLRSMVSYRSRYDAGIAAVHEMEDDFPNFSPSENQGKRVFISSCATCHMRLGQTAHFSMLRPMSNGLDDEMDLEDGGVGDIEMRSRSVGKFKSPGLRNVEVTGPYMHDGRFFSLEEVVNHYSDEVKAHPNLGDENLRRFHFDAEQKAALVAFLKTLTDSEFLADPRYSNPYRVANVGIQARAGSETPAGLNAADIESWLTRFDDNADGYLVRSESTAAAATLVRQGLGDGKRGHLTLRREGDGRNIGGGLDAIETHLRITLRYLDGNGDGTISEQESSSEFVALGDLNQDGSLDRGESRALAERYQKEVVPHVLRHFMLEAHLANSPSAGIRAADANGDGRVTRQEHPDQFDDWLARADRNQDGELDKKELERLRLFDAVDVIMYLPGPEGFNGDRLYRGLASLGLDADMHEKVATVITDHQNWLAEDAIKTRRDLLAGLRAILGDSWYAKLDAELSKRGRDQIHRQIRGEPELLDWMFSSFDLDRDERLSGEERRVIALRLEQVPGGFDPFRAAYPSDDERRPETVDARILALDKNGDGVVELQEMPDRMRAELILYDRDESVDLDRDEIASMSVRDLERRTPSSRSTRPGRLASPLTGISLGRVLPTDRVQIALDRLELPEELRAVADAFLAKIDDMQRMEDNRRLLMQKIGAIIGPKLQDEFLEALASQEIFPDPPTEADGSIAAPAKAAGAIPSISLGTGSQALR